MLLLLLSTSLLALDKAVWKIHLSQFHIAIFDALSLHFGRARVLPRIVSTLNFTTASCHGSTKDQKQKRTACIRLARISCRTLKC